MHTTKAWQMKSQKKRWCWRALTDSHRKYAAIYQTPEVMSWVSSQHIATPWKQHYILNFTLFFPVKQKKSKGDPDAFKHSLLHMKYSGLLCNVHWPALFILNRYITQTAWEQEAPTLWMIHKIQNDSPSWESCNLEEEGGQQGTQAWLCWALQASLKSSVPPVTVKLYGGWRRWRSWSGGYFSLFSIPSQFHGLICFLLSGGAPFVGLVSTCQHLGSECWPWNVAHSPPLYMLSTCWAHSNIQHTFSWSSKKNRCPLALNATTRTGFDFCFSIFRSPGCCQAFKMPWE